MFEFELHLTAAQFTEIHQWCCSNLDPKQGLVWQVRPGWIDWADVPTGREWFSSYTWCFTLKEHATFFQLTWCHELA